MPTYEYIREDGTRFEVIQKFSDAPLTTCPETGQSTRRVISGGSGVIYKGSGWYITDYKNGTSNGSKPTTENKDKTEPKQETKPSENTNTTKAEAI
jgi:putative FmdB family regulatory protein